MLSPSSNTALVRTIGLRRVVVSTAQARPRCGRWNGESLAKEYRGREGRTAPEAEFLQVQAVGREDDHESLECGVTS